jgi:hypothetical protein
MKYRKKPIVIEAVQWRGDNADECHDFAGASFSRPSGAFEARVYAEKEDTWVNCPVGHYVIKGVAGEFYPCDPAVFGATYEPADQTPAPA